MSGFEDLFKPFDDRIMSVLGDDILIYSTNGDPVETVRGVLRRDVDDEELLSRYEVDITTIEISDTDLHLVKDDTVFEFNGIKYTYVTDKPMGSLRHLVIVTEVI